jgi:hypothetical protein
MTESAVLATHPSFLRRFFRNLLIWTPIVCVCAAPSFMLSEYFDLAGRIVGVAIVIITYTMLVSLESVTRFRQNPIRRRALRITYGLRLAACLTVYPGTYLDVIPGMVAIGLVSGITGQQLMRVSDGSPLTPSFAPTLAVVLIQALLVNVILSVGYVIVWAFCRSFMKPDPAGFEVIPDAMPANTGPHAQPVSPTQQRDVETT